MTLPNVNLDDAVTMLDRPQAHALLGAIPNFAALTPATQQAVRTTIDQAVDQAERGLGVFVTPAGVNAIINVARGTDTEVNAKINAAVAAERTKLGRGPVTGTNPELERYDEALRRRGVTDDVMAEFFAARARGEGITIEEARRRWESERQRTMTGAHREFEKNSAFDGGEDDRNPYLFAGWQNRDKWNRPAPEAALTPENVSKAVEDGIRRAQRPAETPGT